MYYHIFYLVTFVQVFGSVWDPLKDSFRNVRVSSKKMYEGLRQGGKIIQTDMKEVGVEIKI